MKCAEPDCDKEISAERLRYQPRAVTCDHECSRKRSKRRASAAATLATKRRRLAKRMALMAADEVAR